MVLRPVDERPVFLDGPVVTEVRGHSLHDPVLVEVWVLRVSQGVAIEQAQGGDLDIGWNHDVVVSCVLVATVLPVEVETLVLLSLLEDLLNVLVTCDSIQVLVARGLLDVVDPCPVEVAAVSYDSVEQGHFGVVSLVEGNLLNSARNEVMEADLRKNALQIRGLSSIQVALELVASEADFCEEWVDQIVGQLLVVLT